MSAERTESMVSPGLATAEPAWHTPRQIHDYLRVRAGRTKFDRNNSQIELLVGPDRSLVLSLVGPKRTGPKAEAGQLGRGLDGPSPDVIIASYRWRELTDTST